MALTLIDNISSLLLIENQGRPYLRGQEMQDFPQIKKAWLLIEDERILDFGPQPYQGAAADHYIDARGGMVLPAYVDSHSHTVYAGSREEEFAQKLAGLSYAEIAAAGGGILNSVAKLRAYTEEQLLAEARPRVEALIAMGTGVLEIKSGYGLDLASECKMLRVARRLGEEYPLRIVTSFLGAHAIPPEFEGRSEAYVDHIIEEILPVVVAESLADYLDVFCEEGYFTLAQSLRLVAAAEAYGLPVKLHVNQFNSLGAVPALVDRGALSLDHLEVMTEADIAALASSQTVATLLPGCSFYLGIPYAPARELVDRNAIVALASDYNPGSAPSGNMSMILSLACIQQRLLPSEALSAATLNGAAALQLSEDYGSIEKGKYAHLIITQPGLSPASIPYHFGHNPVAQMLLHGRLYAGPRGGKSARAVAPLPAFGPRLRSRVGERLLGESLKWCDSVESAAESAADFVLLGLPEDIGVRANLGRPGAAGAWSAFIAEMEKVQENRFLSGARIAVAPPVDFSALMARAEGLDPAHEADLAELRALTAAVDQITEAALLPLFKAGKVPLVIGGGHNNAYPILEAARRCWKRPMDVLNIDPHADYRALEGRHSGNAFHYAHQSGALRRYAVFGLHQGSNNQSILEHFHDRADLYYLSQDELLTFSTDERDRLFKDTLHWLGHGRVGLELDLDSLAGMPVSAMNASGLTMRQARLMVKTAAALSRPYYFHLPEGAPALAAYPGQEILLAKAMVYLVSDFVKAFGEG